MSSRRILAVTLSPACRRRERRRASMRRALYTWLMLMSVATGMATVGPEPDKYDLIAGVAAAVIAWTPVIVWRIVRAVIKQRQVDAGVLL